MLVLEALGRMGREPRGEALVGILKQYAPTWLAQLPALLTDDELAAVQRRAQGTTRERMLRELIEALDALGMHAPLVLLLEDPHWGDPATHDLVARGHVRDVDGQWTLSVPVQHVASGVPDTLWQMVETQIEQLTAHEQAVLAVASVAGADFSAALSTVDGIDAHQGERCCEML